MVSTVLNFTIAANTSSAEAGVARVGAAFDKAGNAAASMATKFEVTESNAARVAKSLGVELSLGAERAVSKLEGLRDHLERTGAPAQDLVRVTEALAAADKKYADSLSSTTKQMSVWQEHGTAMAATAGVMATALFGFGVVAVKAFSESQEVIAQLDAVLESTGHTADGTKEEVLELSDALSKITPFDDEVITQGQTMLLMFTNIGEEIRERTVKAMLDLATRMEIDVPTAAKMLGKALDQPAEGFTALAKATGKFTDAQVSTIKEMVAMGETGKAQAAILDLVEKKVGGAAEAMGKTLPGQLKIAETAAGNFNEEVGSKLVPTLQSLITEFPNVAAAAVGVKGAWDNLGISGGELLIAIPLLKTAFAGMGASLTGMVASSGPIALGIIGFTALAGTIYAAVKAGQALNEWQRSSVQANQDAVRATDALTKKAKEYGIELAKGNESQEQYNARLFQSIAQHEKLHPAISKSTTAQVSATNAVKSHVVTLQQQIEKQKALVESLSHQVGKDKELTEATAKLDTMLKTAGASTQKLGAEMKKLETQYASTTGKIALEIEAIKEDIAFMEKHRGSTEALSVAKEKLGQKTFELIAIQAKHPELLKKTEVALQEVNVHLVGQRSAVELLTVAYDNFRDSILEFSKLDFGQAMISNNETLAAAAKRADEARESIGKLNEMMKVETPEALKPAKQAFEDMGRQVSTVVTDLGKGIADALVKWEGFGNSMIKIAQEFGTGILRTLIETMFKPLEGLLQNLAKKLSDMLGGIFGGAGGKGLNLGSLLGGIPILGAGLGAGFLGEQFGGGAAGTIGGAAVGGLGAAVTAGALAPGAGGAFAGMGAGAMGILGAIPVWGWAAIAAAVLAGPVIGMLTQRGREKVTATGGAENLSENVWQGIIPDVKAGNLSIDEGIAAVNAAWTSYETFLRTNLKDSVVIQRSLDTQRGTLTQSLAELEAMRTQMGTEGLADLRGFLDEMARTGVVTDEAIAGLKGVVAQMKFAGLEAETAAAQLGLLGAEFLKTGEMTEEFAEALESAGGSADFFTKLTGEIKRLQGLRSELGSLKQMVDSFLPKQKTWMENFIETGKITEDMAEKIREAGGDIEDFKKFADMKSLKDSFASLVEGFTKTGIVSKELLDMVLKFGGEGAASFIALAEEAEASGKTIGELAKGSEATAKIIQDAFDATGKGIDTIFTDAAQKLSDSLTKMDENLSKAIGDLQTALVTMIQNLIDVILEVPGAAEKAARDANFFLQGIKDKEVTVKITTTYETLFKDDGGLAEYERRLTELTNQGFAPGTVGVPIPTRQPTFPAYATGTDYVPRTGLAVVHQGEAIIPAGENKSGNVTFQFTGDIVANNPDQLMDEVERYLSTNRDGVRVRIQKALKLRQPGAF